MGADDDPVTLLAGRTPAWLEREVLTLAPEERREVRGADWAGCFAVLEHGRLQVEDTSGRRAWLETGASFSLPPDATALTADGAGQAVVALVRRRVGGGRIRSRAQLASSGPVR